MQKKTTVARSSKPVMVVAETVADFDLWLKQEHKASRTSSRLPVSASVDGTTYHFVQLNTRVGLGRQNFSRIQYVNCEQKALDWFKDLVNSRIK